MDDTPLPNPATHQAPSAASDPSTRPSDNSRQPLLNDRVPDRNADRTTDQPPNVQSNDGLQVRPEPQRNASEARDPVKDLKAFSKALGINPDTGKSLKNHNSLYQKIQRAYWLSNFTYSTLLCSSLGILLAQVVFSATSSVLAANNKNNRYDTSIVVLNAVVTVISFIAGSIKSMGEPTRARQYRDALRACKDEADKAFADFNFMDTGDQPGEKGPKTESPREAVDRIYNSFEQAQKDGMANMPDVWVPNNTNIGNPAGRGRPV